MYQVFAFAFELNEYSRFTLALVEYNSQSLALDQWRWKEGAGLSVEGWFV